MTKEEHITRAMLLGFKYIPHHGYYIDFKSQYPDGSIALRYDAITLELLPVGEVRMRLSSPFRKTWYDHT